MAEPGSNQPVADEPGVDELLDRLEKLVGRLAAAAEPIEDLARAYEEGSRLLARAEERLAAAARAAEEAAGPA